MLLMLTIDDATAIGDAIGSRHIDVLLMRVASAITRTFPYPAINSRLMGNAFLTYAPDADIGAIAGLADLVIREVNAIEVPGFPPGFRLRGSVGVAAIADGDIDLGLRLAEAAAAEARAAGGDRVVVAGPGTFTSAQAVELTGDMDIGSWEVWLQPVVTAEGRRAEFHEALARFNSGHRRVVSRADFFVAGLAAGLLERFDLMMLRRVIELLAVRPAARLSMNVSHETFVADAFPESFLGPLREVPGVAERMILEIAPRCLATAAADDDVRSRLRALAAAGIAVAIDDFGSGVCRLRTLTQFPLAIVKLDELVTRYVDDDPLQREFVRAVVGLCHARGMTTVAEYTRSAEQLARLVEDGVDLFQGELFGMPGPAEQVCPAEHAVTSVRG